MYYFVSKDDFETAIENDEFLEYELVHKVAYYGTKKAEILSGIQDGSIMMTEIDTQGLKQVIEKHPNLRENFTSFFLDVPNSEIERRYFERNPDGKLEDIQNRLESTSHEREQAQKYCDHIIDATGTPEEVLAEVLKIMKQ